MTSQWRHYQKQWQNSDLRETKQIIYHSKGFDKNYPEMCFSLNLSYCVQRLNISKTVQLILTKLMSVLGKYIQKFFKLKH